MVVVGEATDCGSTAYRVAQHHPNLVVRDPDVAQLYGFVLTEEPHRIAPYTPVVALTLSEARDSAERAAAAVAMLLLKDGVTDRPLTAIRDVTRTAFSTYQPTVEVGSI